MEVVKYVWAVVAGYLLGAIPVGRIAGKTLKGVDVTEIGSGRIGATNVLRAAGVGAAAITLVGDAAKGMLATIVGRLLGGTPLAAALAGSAAVIGHDCSVFLKWGGGVGTITSLGATAMLAGPVAGGLAALGALVVGLSRYSSLGSMVIAIFLPIALLVSALTTGSPTVYVVHGLIGGGVALWALRPNIKRLLSGTERRIGDKINV
ncbi:MAG: glycerol-3-phosphate 1-O-acyltransferase PlsY [Anaerolineae bacterium]|nr:glycerol-3-phosphate 1-O-acyltransferase PlsY [Anaerolineae bacterium]